MSASTYFFFSSRRRHTRLQGDWSSDVCSSDLRLIAGDFGPLTWLADVPVADRGYVAMQMMNAASVIGGYYVEVPPAPPATTYDDRVELRPDALLTRAQACSVVVREVLVTPAVRCTDESARRFE